MMAWMNLENLTQAVSEIKSYCAAAFATITHSHNAATTSAAGFMSADDKKVVDGLFPTAYSTEGLTAEDCSFEGGYIIIGNMVFLNLFVELESTRGRIYGLPMIYQYCPIPEVVVPAFQLTYSANPNSVTSLALINGDGNWLTVYGPSGSWINVSASYLLYTYTGE